MDKPSFFRGCNQEPSCSAVNSNVIRGMTTETGDENLRISFTLHLPKSSGVITVVLIVIVTNSSIIFIFQLHRDLWHLNSIQAVWNPLISFFIIDIEGALVSMSTVREKVSCTFSYRALRMRSYMGGAGLPFSRTLYKMNRSMKTL